MYEHLPLIADAIDDPEIYILAFQAMLESAETLFYKYGVPVSETLRHIQDLLLRFANRSLGDTCARVGADIVRKLAASDRLIGAVRLCREQGITPAYICVGIAGATYAYLKEKDFEQTREHASQALDQLSGMTDSFLLPMILRYYDLLVADCTITDLRRAAQREKAENSYDVV